MDTRLYTDRARKALQYASQEAGRFMKAEVSRPMLCIGVLSAIRPNSNLSEPLEVALEGAGFHKSALLFELRQELGPRNGEEVTNHLPFDSAAEQVVLDSVATANSMGRSCVHLEDLFFTLLGCEDTILRPFWEQRNLTAELLKTFLPADAAVVWR